MPCYRITSFFSTNSFVQLALLETLSTDVCFREYVTWSSEGWPQCVTEITLYWFVHITSAFRNLFHTVVLRECVTHQANLKKKSNYFNNSARLMLLLSLYWWTNWDTRRLNISHKTNPTSIPGNMYFFSPPTKNN